MLSKVVTVLSSQDGSGNQDITFSASPSWTPKIAIFQTSHANTSLDTFQEHYSFGYGFTDGTNQRCVASVSQDNATSSNCARAGRTNSVIECLTWHTAGSATIIDALASFVQWLTNGVKIHWDDVPNSQFYFSVMFLGGDDITNTSIGSLATGTTTGNKSITSLSYKPEWGIFISQNNSSGEDVGNGTNNAICSIGCADKNNNQWVQANYSSNGSANSSTRMYYSHSKIVVYHTTTIQAYATFSSWNDNGFTLNVGDAWGTSQNILYLVGKGGSVTVGNSTEPAQTGTQQINTTGKVNGLLVLGLDTSTPDAVQTNHQMTIGMASGSSEQACITLEDQNSAGNMIIVSRLDTDQIYLNCTANATASSSTLDDEATLSAFNTGNFVLDWTNIGQTRPFRWMTFASSIVSVTKTETIKHNIESQVIDTNTLKFNITQQITPKSLTLRNDITIPITTPKQLTLKNNIEQEIIDTTTLKHNITTELTDTNTFRFDIIESITPKSLTLLQNINQSITDTSTFINNINQEITKSSTFIFNINQEITKTIILINNIVNETTKQLSLLFNIDAPISAVIKTLSLLHNLESQTTKSNTFRFDITTPLTKTLSIIKNITSEISPKSLILRHDIINEVVKTNSLLHDVLNEVIKTNSLLFNIDSQIVKTLTLPHHITQQIIKTSNLIHNITTSLEKTINLLSSIAQDVPKSLTLKFDLISQTIKQLSLIFDIEAVGAVVKALSLKHNIESQTTKQTILRYDITLPLVKTATILHNILTEISAKSVTLPFNILQEVAESTSLLFDINEQIITTSTISHNIQQEVLKSTSLLFSITNELIVDTTIIYNLLQEVSNDLTIIQNIEQGVIKSIILKHTITEIIEKTNNLRFNITQLVEKQNTLIHNINSQTTKSITLVHNILSEISRIVTIAHNITTELTKVNNIIFNLTQEVPAKSTTLKYDIIAQTTKLLRLLHNINNVVIKTSSLLFTILEASTDESLRGKLLRFLQNQYSIVLPSKNEILWGEWYNGQFPITVEILPLNTVIDQQRSTIIYKEELIAFKVDLFLVNIQNDINDLNIPLLASNMINHITDIFSQNQQSNILLSNTDCYELRIRSANYVPDSEYNYNKVVHYRYVIQLRKQRLIT